MGCLPYFKFYPADWLSDRKVRRLSPDARALYWDLLCEAWMEGYIPSDVETLAADAGRWGYTRKRFERAWPQVEQFWVHGRDGELLNLRQEEEREKAQAIYDARVAAGRLGGRPAANGTAGKAHG